MRYLIVSIILVFSNTAFGQKLDRSEINEALQGIQSVPVKHHDKEGVWFSKSNAEVLLDLVSNKLKLSLDIIDQQTTQIKALQSAVDGYKLSSQSYLELANLNRRMFDTAMEHIPDLDPPEPSWYESSKATFIYGIIVGGVVVFSTTYLATKALEK